MTVYIDDREPLSVVTMASNFFPIKKKRLDVGDIVYKDLVGIERKTAQDFYSSLSDGRLFNQAVRLSETFKYPLLVVIGKDSDFYNYRNYGIKEYLGAISSIIARTGVYCYRVKDLWEFFYFSSSFIEKAIDGKNKIITKKIKISKNPTINLLCSINGIGEKKAQKIFDFCEGDLYKLFIMDDDEFLSINGIGKRDLERIREIFKSRC